MCSTSSAAGFTAKFASPNPVLPPLFSTPPALLHWLPHWSRQPIRFGHKLIGGAREWNQGRSGALRRKHGVRVMTHEKAAVSKRILIVEDELMIRMLLEGMLTDLGHSVAAEAGGLDEAILLARQAEFDLAVLDVNLNGTPVTPVVEILVERGLPFIFASGYGQRGLPEAYRSAPILQKPFQVDALEQAIQAVANTAN